MAILPMPQPHYMQQVSKSIFLIMGCQRSGSTLLESIFDAHPDVRVIGEENWDAYRYFQEPEQLPDFPEQYIGLRIPAATHQLSHAIERHPDAHVLFTLRDPRDVITSMRKLQLMDLVTGKKASWLEAMGHGEIKNCLDNLPEHDPLHATWHWLRKKTDDLNDARFGGLCWVAKNRFLPLYQKSALKTEVVRYEQLTNHSEQYLRKLCEFLELEWHDNLMNHQNFSSGSWSGTNKGEAIHRRSVEAYKKHLTLNERNSLHSLIEADMETSGYHELFEQQ